MSSYFDEMASRAEQDGAGALAKVHADYGAYLDWAATLVHKADAHVLASFRLRFEGLRAQGAGEFGEEDQIQEFHSLAHELGRTRLKLRAGRRLGDNPWRPRYGPYELLGPPVRP